MVMKKKTSILTLITLFMRLNHNYVSEGPELLAFHAGVGLMPKCRMLQFAMVLSKEVNCTSLLDREQWDHLERMEEMGRRVTRY